MRRLLKAFVEAALAASGASARGARRRRGQTLVLAYHGVIPRGEHAAGEHNLHVAQDLLGAHLDALAKTHAIVSLDDLAATNDADRPRAIITFDDAYRGALTVGVGEVVRRGLPATVFVAPGLFGRTMWWDRHADTRSGTVPANLRVEALTTYAGRTDEILRAFGPGNEALPAWATIATEDEVRAAARHPGITIGAHSWSHPNLVRLTPVDLREEMEAPLAWLRTLGSAMRPVHAFPYGQTAPAIAAAAAAAGYTQAFHVTIDWIPAGACDCFHLPRWNVSAGLSATGFSLRACDVLVP